MHQEEFVAGIISFAARNATDIFLERRGANRNGPSRVGAQRYVN
jgi:hypothetical protein